MDKSRSESSGENGVATPSKPEKKPVKDNWLLQWPKAAWTKLGLSPLILRTMAKGGIPPTIALAIFRADSVANTFSTLGYLMAIVSVLGMTIMPRAKFIQTMLFNLIFTCLAAAVQLLLIFCSVKARQHTTPPGAPLSGYNSSASAVCAILLFFQAYWIGSAKSKYPQLTFPTIIYAIFMNVSSAYAPEFPTMAYGLAFIRRMLTTFLAGFGISFAVHFIVFPTTSRKIVFAEMTGYLMGLRGLLKAHKNYFHSMEKHDMFAAVVEHQDRGEPLDLPEAKALKGATTQLTTLHGKLMGDLSFAKKEVAFGKLGPEDLKKIAGLLRSVLLPALGLSSILDIFERLSKTGKWYPYEGTDTEAFKEDVINDWNFTFTTIQEQFDSILDVMDEGLQHVLLRLQLIKPPKNSQADVEGAAQTTKPGNDGFAQYLDQKSEAFYAGKESTLRSWCDRKGIDLPPDFFENPNSASFMIPDENQPLPRRGRNKRQVYLILYMEFLMYHASKSILKFVQFADERAKSGKLAKNRLIVPGLKRLKKWAMNCLTMEDSIDEERGDLAASNNTVFMGEAYNPRKDPEHLPPQNQWEKIGDGIRNIPGFFRSSHSAFGFRVACATMSIAILAFLEQTQAFFVRQRLIWAMIMVNISMTPTAGASLFGFILRIIGTVGAMCLAFVVYYVPDRHIAGVIVIFWLLVSMGYYILLKKPQYTIIGVISVVTTTMIIGYELQSRKLGRAVATSNGQPFYPIYELGPYRLACVAAGLFVAWIWTVFPYPITEHSMLRQTLGSALYLTANFYSIVHETVKSRVRGDYGDPEDKKSAAHKMDKARHMVYGKMLLTLGGMQNYANFLKWEIPVGGRFPRQQYLSIMQNVRNINNYMALVSYASNTFSKPTNATESQWHSDFKRLMSASTFTSHEITSLLVLLSNSITSGHPLPPYLRTPTPYGLTQRLESMDRDILSVKHINEPGYAAFAVVQISTRCIVTEIDELLTTVKELVGVLDFSFHTVSTADSSSSTFETSSQTQASESGSERQKRD